MPEKELLEKAATIRRFEYSPLGSELIRQTSIVEKQYQGLNKFYEFDKKEGNYETIDKEEKYDGKTPIIKKCNKSNLI